MKRFNHILVGVDEFDSGFHALDQAIRLAKWSKSQVTVLAVVPFYEGDLSLVGVKNPKSIIDGPGRDILIRALDLADSHHFHIQVACETGDPAEKILSHAQSIESDLIVIGAGRILSRLAAIMGGIFGRIMRQCRQDVLIIPEGTVLAWDHVLVILSGQEQNTGMLIQSLELLTYCGGKSMTVSIPDRLSDSQANQIFNEKAIQDCLDRIRASHIHAIGIQDCRLVRRPHDLDFSISSIPEQPSLVILSRPDGNRFNQFRYSMTAEKWIRLSPCPVMQIHQPPI
ncbi:MAG: universal stress protein [Desulfatirhabdiaceae bacterium]